MKKILFFCIVMLALSNNLQSQTPVHTFSIGDGDFLLDGKPMQILSGEMHFARIPRECWRDRLMMAKAMGLNTVATYIFWNYHEPRQGVYNFSGNADVAEFARIAQEVGLWVIIRPSPYACAEWEFGGYPWWLQQDKALKVRSRDPVFMELSRKYFGELGKQLAPLQITRGGPIIMVQLENEYGSYDKDKVYLEMNVNIIRDSGFEVDLYTCDGPSQLPAGYLPGVFPSVNGLDNVKEVRALINQYNNWHGPYFIAEWYPAWFDSWGKRHNVVPYQDVVGIYDSVIAAGFSINIYMLHGGTTRDFWNGANMDRRTPYMPQTSSYDYDAPIDEAGNATPKYMAFREVIRKNLPAKVAIPEVPPKKKSIAIPPVMLTGVAPIFKNLPKPVASERPLTFEELGQGYGYVLYRTHVAGPQKGVLKITHLRDYGLVYINGKQVALLDRRFSQESTEVEIPKGGATLDIFVENLGRINYGPYLNDNLKGITEKVTLNDTEITGWKIYQFPFNDHKGFSFKSRKPGSGPALSRGTFTLQETGDSYLDMRTFGKGVAWINGHNLGRYWDIGPQQTLYIPAPWLKTGENEVVVFEMLKPEQAEISALDHPVLDQLNNPKVYKPSLSTGRAIKIANSWTERYSAGGEQALADGLRGGLSYNDGYWQGYESVDLDAVIDLGEMKPIHSLSTGCYQTIGAWIFLPTLVAYYGSADGIEFTKLGEVVNSEPVTREEAFFKDFRWQMDDKSATVNSYRYIRVVAKNLGTCPPGHPGSGKKSWLFVDEVTVE